LCGAIIFRAKRKPAVFRNRIASSESAAPSAGSAAVPTGIFAPAPDVNAAIAELLGYGVSIREGDKLIGYTRKLAGMEDRR